MMQQFEETLNIGHVKTTAFHPQSNGNLERMHSTLKNLIKTTMAENHNDWDANLKYISFAINTSVNQTTGETPLKGTLYIEGLGRVHLYRETWKQWLHRNPT